MKQFSKEKLELQEIMVVQCLNCLEFDQQCDGCGEDFDQFYYYDDKVIHCNGVEHLCQQCYKQQVEEHPCAN